MRGQLKAPEPGRECQRCQVRCRMGDHTLCSKCERETPVKGNTVTDQQRRTLFQMYRDSVSREFRRD